MAQIPLLNHKAKDPNDQNHSTEPSEERFSDLHHQRDEEVSQLGRWPDWQPPLASCDLLSANQDHQRFILLRVLKIFCFSLLSKTY